MLRFNIPGDRDLAIAHLVLDFNGTLACDGHLIEGVSERLDGLADELTIHILTADTFGSAARETAQSPGCLTTLPATAQDRAKENYVLELGAQQVIAIGNGSNDRLMLAKAALGIALLQTEGAASATLLAADIVVPDILAALDLLTHPQRLVATLRL